MNIFTYLTPITYWILIILWLFILGFYLKRLRSKEVKGRLISVLIIILAIDAFRTLFESFYFGAWYTAVAGFLPKSVHTFLIRPEMVFIPKTLNVIAAVIILVLLIYKWLPKEESEKNALEKLIKEKTIELTKSQEKYQDLYDNAPDMYVSVDAKTSLIVECNQMLATRLGYLKDEIIGCPIFDMYHSDSLDGAKKAFQRFVSTGDVHNEELQLKTKDGRKVHVTLNVTSIKDENGNILYSRSAWRDITDIKQNEINYQETIESSIDGFWVTDTKGNLLNVNRAYCQMIGYKKSELLNMAIQDLDAAMTSNEIKYKIQTVMQTGSIRFETRHRCKNGELLDIEISASFTQKVGGQFVVFLRDITEKKLLETKLQQSQKMESIGTLAGGIAHDFNNILSSIIGFSELALDSVDEGSEVEDDLQEVCKAGMRAKDLVKQILTFARQSDETVKPIQVHIIANEVLKFIKSSIPTTIQVNDKIKSDSFIIGSSTQIDQVFMNLCTNAAYAMEENGGILEVSVNDTTIDRMAIPDLKSGEYIEIKVTDTGMGISPQNIHTIFDPYFTTKAVGEGTGMGLAVVHGIVENYGGQITVKSTVGKGTCFTIYLPITKKRKVHTHSEKKALPLGTENILFVDDEASIAKMGSKILEQLGYSVTTRTSSIEALELFRTKPYGFDLVVTDMTMPNMTGDKLAIELMKIRSDIPVLLCTGYSKKISEEGAAEIGIKALVYKPVVKSDLAETVRKLLDGTKSYV